jgi:hypothetical protein
MSRPLPSQAGGYFPLDPGLTKLINASGPEAGYAVPGSPWERYPAVHAGALFGRGPDNNTDYGLPPGYDPRTGTILRKTPYGDIGATYRPPGPDNVALTHREDLPGFSSSGVTPEANRWSGDLGFDAPGSQFSNIDRVMSAAPKGMSTAVQPVSGQIGRNVNPPQNTQLQPAT